jgi:hypothetical protein
MGNFYTVTIKILTRIFNRKLVREQLRNVQKEGEKVRKTLYLQMKA